MIHTILHLPCEGSPDLEYATFQPIDREYGGIELEDLRKFLRRDDRERLLMVERLPLEHVGLNLWFDEDGQMKKLPINQLSPLLTPHTIAGIMLVTGPMNPSGSISGLSTESQQRLRLLFDI